MKRGHRMPFGAELAGPGVRFRLWAPAAAKVALRLEKVSHGETPMKRLPDGWHELVVAEAGPGDRYRYRLDDGLLVPDPASRFNPDDVHEASEVVDPESYEWRDDEWTGRPWEQAVIYELHVGTFTQAGDFAGVEARLDYLSKLGITAIELMPVADFPGRRNWGYDGVLPYAPDASYGRPEDFKRLIDAAHARGLMVLLDVVYNHFGPDGNYLHAYAPDFFTDHHHTPWGAAINFDGPGSRCVRDFFIHNALYWLEEYHLDGLRLDAVHAICDDSSPDIIEELASAVHDGPGRARHVHIVLENDRNQSRYLGRADHGKPRYATAQWNDDAHHVFHVLATGETDGYYADYADDPVAMLLRCLAEGFVFQGQVSPFRNGARRGEPSARLPPTAFVNFLQTHDQVGNRAFGERLCHLAEADVLEALAAVFLLAPQTPMLFMGEEFASDRPFLYFCDFAANPDLAQAVTNGRRREFACFSRFADETVRETIPDPNSAATFASSVLSWSPLDASQQHLLASHRRLLELRRRHIAPRLAGMNEGSARAHRHGKRGIEVAWRLGDGSTLTLVANLGPESVPGMPRPSGRLLHASPDLSIDVSAGWTMPKWSVAWFLDETTNR